MFLHKDLTASFPTPNIFAATIFIEVKKGRERIRPEIKKKNLNFKISCLVFTESMKSQNTTAGPFTMPLRQVVW